MLLKYEEGLARTEKVLSEGQYYLSFEKRLAAGHVKEGKRDMQE